MFSFLYGGLVGECVFNLLGKNGFNLRPDLTDNIATIKENSFLPRLNW